MSAAMTYATLLADLSTYAERSDDAFTSQRDRFIMLAENRIAAEARGLGQIVVITDDLITGQNGSALSKPARWRETASLTIGIGASFNRRKTLKLRGYEYVRRYWPDPTLTAEPIYYADWDWAHFLIGPSPDLAYPYELIFFERPQPLDTNNQTNWTCQFAPQLLLNACLLEASAYVKNSELINSWQAGYDRALKQVEFESQRRLRDRAQGSAQQ